MKKEKMNAFVTVMHYSHQFRPRGMEYVERYIETLFDSCKKPFKLYIIDNGSFESQNLNSWKEKWKFNWKYKFDNIDYVYIPNQFLKGITGAWNLGIYQAFNEENDIIHVTNDDIMFNDTINEYLEFIENDLGDSLYGPVSNGILGNTLQKQNYTINYIGKIDTLLNGFFFSFNRDFYIKHRYSEAEMFAMKHKNDGGDGKWGGQEGEFIRFKEGGAKFILYGPCWIYHEKERGYKLPRDVEKGKIKA